MIAVCVCVCVTRYFFAVMEVGFLLKISSFPNVTICQSEVLHMFYSNQPSKNSITQHLCTQAAQVLRLCDACGIGPMYTPSRMAARKVAMVAEGRLKRSSIDPYFAQRLVVLGWVLAES